MSTIEELSGRVDDLARRVGDAESVLAIHALKARYAELVWDGGPALGVAEGRAAIADRLARPTLVFSRHLFVSPRITVDGDRATGRWELLCPCTGADGTALWMSGQEDDVYRRVDGTWLHASMSLTTVFVSPVGDGWPRILA